MMKSQDDESQLTPSEEITAATPSGFFMHTAMFVGQSESGDVLSWEGRQQITCTDTVYSPLSTGFVDLWVQHREQESLERN